MSVAEARSDAARRGGGEIVAVGGANVDWACQVAQPARLGTSNPGAVRRSFGGVARNVCCNLARLGVPAVLFSAVGRDDAGAALIKDCERFGVDCGLVLRSEGATSSYVATLDADGELVIAVAAMDIIGRLTPGLIAAQAERLGRADAIFADANLSEQGLRTLAELAARGGVPLALDPVSTRKAVRVQAILEARLPIFLLTPNRDELGVLTGEAVASPGDVERAAGKLQDRGVENVLVGLGAAGALLATPQRLHRVAAKSAQVCDVTGAGDAAMAAVLWAWRAGRSMAEAAAAGQVAAAMTVASLQSVSADLTPDILARTLPMKPEVTQP